MKLPEGYQTVMPYLIVESAEGFLDFIKTVFNAKEKAVYHDEEGGIMHAEAIIGESTIMFANSTSRFQPMSAGLYVNVEDADATYHLALKKGATSIMELSNQSYGRTSGVVDSWGNTWWITTPA